MSDLPARIWIDLTQLRIGYTSDPLDAREDDTEFVRADLVRAAWNAFREARTTKDHWIAVGALDALTGLEAKMNE